MDSVKLKICAFLVKEKGFEYRGGNDAVSITFKTTSQLEDFIEDEDILKLHNEEDDNFDSLAEIVEKNYHEVINDYFDDWIDLTDEECKWLDSKEGAKAIKEWINENIEIYAPDSLITDYAYKVLDGYIDLRWGISA